MTNLEAWAPQLKCLGDQRAPWKFYLGGYLEIFRLNIAWEPKGLPEIFPRAHSCSPLGIESMKHYKLLLNVEVHLLRILLCPNANFSELPHSLNIYGSDIDESFVLRSKGTLLVTHLLVYLTEHLRLSCTHLLLMHCSTFQSHST